MEPTSSTFTPPSSVLKHVLEPLCPETAELLEAVDADPTDIFEVELDSGDPDWFIISFYHKGLGEERLAASWAARASGTRFPEMEKLDGFGGQIRVAATDISAVIMSSAWPAAQVIMSADARLVYEKLLLQVTHQTLASQERARFHLEGTVPTAPEGWIDHPDYPLEPYQKTPAVTALGQDGFGGFMDRGTGKTATLINIIMNEAAEKRKTDPTSIYYAIVVCPKNVRLNWLREVQKFATLSGRVTVLRGTLLDRLKLFNEVVEPDPEGKTMFSIVVINYESLANTPQLLLWPWDKATLDESHEIKSTYAKIYKAAWNLRDAAASRVALTGTPVTNSLLDLYTQLEFLGRGFSGFNRWQAFKKFYAKYEKNAYTGRDELKGFQNLPFLQERLSRLCYMISIKQALPWLPKQTWGIKEVSMSARQKELYKAMQTQLVQEIDAKTQGGMKTVTADCILTMLLRLSQITSGFISWDPVIDEDGAMLQPKKVEFLADNPKLEQLVADLKEMRPDQKKIIWSCWIPSIHMISARLVKEGIKHGIYYGNTKDKDRASLERDFNQDPTLKVFLGNPAAGGAGLNLWGYDADLPEGWTDHGMNADESFYYDQNWSMVTRSQSEGRNFRRGTRVPIHYSTYVCPNTIDQEIYDRVMQKIEDAASIQDVREIMKRVLSAVLLTD